MKFLNCPLNGKRSLSEFQYGGVVKEIPGPDDGDAAWSDYLFLEDNIRGVVREWWCHLPSSYWFIAERNTVTDEVITTFDPAEIFAGERTSDP